MEGMVLPKECGYVALVLVLYCLLNFWMAAQVGMARKKYQLFYRTHYASESENKIANLFNCVQARGHQNSLELMPMFFMLMMVGGLRHPCACASLGVLYIISRFFYFTGYATGDPKKRLKIGKYGFVRGLRKHELIFGECVQVDAREFFTQMDKR